MKIIFYINSVAPAGGQERVVCKHVEYACSTCCSVELLTHDNKVPYYCIAGNYRQYKFDPVLATKSSLRIIRAIKLLFGVIFNGIKLRSVWKLHNPDMIYVSSPANFAEVALSGWPISKVMVSEHSSYYAHNILNKLIILSIYRYSYKFFVPTLTDAKLYSKYSVESVYLPNPLPFAPQKRTNNNSKTVLTVGRLVDDKRHLLLLDAWKDTKCRHDGWQLKIIGDGPLKDEIILKIKNFDLTESVSIQDPTSEIIAEYTNASLFLLTSRLEGFGMVLIEAMACGVPCISFKIHSGPIEIIKDGINGFLIANNDVNSYSIAIDNFVENRILRTKLSQGAINSVEKFRDENIKIMFLNNLFGRRC